VVADLHISILSLSVGSLTMAEPLVDFDVSNNGQPLVDGQVLKGLFDLNQLENDPILAGPARLFTNGLGVDLEHMVRQVVETKADKLTFANDPYRPSTRVFAVCMLWGRKKKRHFFRDALFAQSVFAAELGISLFDFLHLRGWSAHLRKDGTVDISYRRIRECLELQDPVVSARFYRLSAIMDRVYRFLHSEDVFTAMPYEKEDDDDDDDDDEDEDDVAKKQGLMDDVDFEFEGRTRRLPTHGKAHLIDFHQQSSAHGRQRREHQQLQLGLSAVVVAFAPILHKKKRKSKPFMEKLFTLIFRDCSTRRQMNEGLQDLMMVCRDRQTTLSKRSTIREWILDPDSVLTEARKCNSGLPLTDYLADLWGKLASKFRMSSIDHTCRGVESEHVILRVVIHIQLKSMDKNRDRLNPSKRALVGLRKNDSLVEASVNKNTTKKRKCVQASVSAELTKLPSFFHLPTDRAHEKKKRKTVAAPLSATTTTIATTTTTMITPMTPLLSYKAPSRWSSIRPAQLDDLRRFNSRLVLECPDFDIHLHHSSLEMYVAWELDTVFHCFEVKQLTPPGVPQQHTRAPRPILDIPDEGSYHRCKPNLAVIRPGCLIYDECFPTSFFRLDMKELILFVLEYGTNDPSRSIPTGETGIGSRVDFGNAGQAMEPGEEKFRPRTLCGTDVLSSHPRGPKIRLMLGRILDRMCRAAKRITEEQGRISSLNHKRYQQFAEHLQSFLFATELTNEWVTIQLLNISHSQSGVRHQDKYSDGREGYNRTICKCFFLIDSAGDLWCFKILAGYRKRVGDYMTGPYSRLLSLTSRLRMFTTCINSKYETLIGLYRGAHHPTKMPTWDDTTHFWLDDYMPFTRQSVGGGLFQDYFLMITGSTRSYWASAACSPMQSLSCRLTVRGMAQLAMMASWQNSFHYFYIVMERMGQLDLSKEDYPIFTYHDICLELFGEKDGGSEIIGGPNPRYSPVGFNFRETFGRDGVLVDKVVDVLFELIGSINAVPDGEMSFMVMEPLLKRTVSDLNKVVHCELGEFRLLVFLQICAHLRIGLRTSTNLREILYPVVGAASHAHILHHGFKADQVLEVFDMLRSEMSTGIRRVPMDEVEPLLCESKAGRLLTKFDVFIKGQALFRLDESGVPWIKGYGEYCWRRIPKLFRNLILVN
jgi:hypothetical protein